MARLTKEEQAKRDRLATQGLQQCSLCDRIKPFNDFPRDTRRRTGRGSRCLACKRNVAREAVSTPKGMRKCTGCRETKPLSKFDVAPNTASGYRKRCRDCVESVNPNVCRRCKQERPTFMFATYSNGTGRKRTCYECEWQVRAH